MALNQVPVKTISNVNKTSCSLHCILHPDCYYFNLQRDTGTWELLEFITDPSLLETKTGWDFIHTNLYAKALCNLKFILLQLQQRIGRTRSFPSVSFQVFTMIRNIIGKHPVNLRCRFEYGETKNGKNYHLDCLYSSVLKTF